MPPRYTTALCLLLAACDDKVPCISCEDSGADDTGAPSDTSDTSETGETGETGDTGAPIDPCDLVPCDTADSVPVQLEQPFLGPYVWFCDAAQGGATYTVALDVEITPKDAAAALLETVYDVAYAEDAGLPPAVITTGVPQDPNGRPLLTCTWDAELALFREERLTLRGG